MDTKIKPIKNKFLIGILLGIIIAFLIYIAASLIIPTQKDQRNIDNDGRFTQDFFSQNIPKWDSYKYLFNNLENKRCLEIGSFEGRSTIYLVENYCNGKGSYVDAVDTWEGSIEHSTADKNGLYNRFINNLNPYIKNHKVNVYRGISSDILIKLIEEVRDEKREKYDFIYIDASHFAKDVLMDTVLSWRLLKNGGLMFFDDYLWPYYKEQPWLKPKVAINGFLESYSTMYELLYKDYQIHIKKISDTPKISP